jgi:hypothetical protein
VESGFHVGSPCSVHASIVTTPGTRVCWVFKPQVPVQRTFIVANTQQPAASVLWPSLAPQASSLLDPVESEAYYLRKSGWRNVG